MVELELIYVKSFTRDCTRVRGPAGTHGFKVSPETERAFEIILEIERVQKKLFFPAFFHPPYCSNSLVPHETHELEVSRE